MGNASLVDLSVGRGTPGRNGNEFGFNNDGHDCKKFWIVSGFSIESNPTGNGYGDFAPTLVDVCVLSSLSGEILYWLATNLCIAVSSSKNIFILINGSFPFCVSIWKGFGLASKSDTLPWERPRHASPNNLWLIE